MATLLTDPLLELTPGPTLPVAAPILAARAAIRAALDDLLAVPDSALESLWQWRRGDPADEADVRYGFYRIHERLEEASAEIVRGRAAAGEGPGVGPAVSLFESATAARWELRAAIAPLTEPDLDRDPGDGEWTIRQTLGHIVQGQRSYGWYSAWWLDRGKVAGPLPERAGDERMPEEPDELDEAKGGPAEIQARLDDLVDVATGRFAGLSEDQLSIPAVWSGLPVDLRFRLGRWGSHIREHIIQVDKTLAMNARPTTEVERIARLIAASYGRLEGQVFGRSEAVLRRPWSNGGSAALVLESCARDIAQVSASVGAAAGAAAGGRGSGTG